MKRIIISLAAAVLLIGGYVFAQETSDPSAVQNPNWNLIARHHWFKWVTVSSRVDVPASGISINGTVMTNTAAKLNLAATNGTVTLTRQVAPSVTNIVVATGVITNVIGSTTNLVTYVTGVTIQVADVNALTNVTFTIQR